MEVGLLDLPEEVLFNILSLVGNRRGELSSVAQTCSQLYQLATDPHLLLHFDFTLLWLKRIPDTGFGFILEDAPTTGRPEGATSTLPSAEVRTGFGTARKGRKRNRRQLQPARRTAERCRRSPNKMPEDERLRWRQRQDELQRSKEEEPWRECMMLKILYDRTSFITRLRLSIRGTSYFTLQTLFPKHSGA